MFLNITFIYHIEPLDNTVVDNPYQNKSSSPPFWSPFMGFTVPCDCCWDSPYQSGGNMALIGTLDECWPTPNASNFIASHNKIEWSSFYVFTWSLQHKRRDIIGQWMNMRKRWMDLIRVHLIAIFSISIMHVQFSYNFTCTPDTSLIVHIHIWHKNFIGNVRPRMKAIIIRNMHHWGYQGPNFLYHTYHHYHCPKALKELH